MEERKKKGEINRRRTLRLKRKKHARATKEDNGEKSVKSKLIEQISPLTMVGPRTMICFDHKLRNTHWGPKDYLFWFDEETGEFLEQFFAHYEKYPRGSRAVENYIVVLPMRPETLDGINLKDLVGIRAEVYVETVIPTYESGLLKGKPKPRNLHYSKVSEILKSYWKVSEEDLVKIRNAVKQRSKT